MYETLRFRLRPAALAAGGCCLALALLAGVWLHLLTGAGAGAGADGAGAIRPAPVGLAAPRAPSAARAQTLATAPPALRAAVEGSLGASPSRHTAARPPLRATYDAGAIRLAGAGWAATVGLSRIGRAGNLAVVTRGAKLVAGGARYGAPGLQESFAATPAGVEQSFTVARRPSGRGPLQIDVGLSGVSAGGAGASLALRDRAGRIVSTYTGLHVTDADGRAVPATMRPAAGGRGIVITIADGRGRYSYPLRVDPYFVQTAELTASDGAANDELGFSVSVSDGVAVVGAPAHAGTGAAYIFAQTEGGWGQVDELTPPDGATGDGFGAAVAISGATIVVGASNHAGHGAAYVWQLNEGAPVYATELSPSDGVSGDHFGSSVATDGGTIVVGAPEHGAAIDGAVYVFAIVGEGWAQTAELTPSDSNSFDAMGGSVGISEAGSTIVAGAENDVANTQSAYVFTLSGGTWSQAAYLNPGGTTANSLDASVAISGSTIVFGAQYFGATNGEALVYTSGDGGATWDLAATLEAPVDGGFFGRAVAVSSGTIVVGAFGADNNRGEAFVYSGGGDDWTEQSTPLTAADGDASDDLGFSAAVSDDTILLGAYGHASTQGAAYVFAPSPAQAGPTFTVTTTSDVSYDGCFVDYCTLRDAIDAADDNSTPAVPDEIAFDIPGSGTQVIEPQSPLPPLTEGVDIDATTQPGYSGTPLIELYGGDCVPDCNGLDLLDAPDSTLRGLAIVGFDDDGIFLSASADVLVQQDWIGWSPLIDGFDGNEGGGVVLVGSADDTIGGSALERDVIAGNGHGDGSGTDVLIGGAESVDDTVSGDWIGLGADGLTPGDDPVGVVIDNDAADNTIGGDESVGDDLYGFYREAIDVTLAGSDNVISGNTIGADSDGDDTSGDGTFDADTGIAVVGSGDTVIGDDAAPGTQADTDVGNEIVGQKGDVGIEIQSSDTTIAGNFIGTDRSGAATDLGNAEGIRIDSGSGNVVGPGNTIAFNSDTGVEVDTFGNQVTGNSIHDNGGPGGLTVPLSSSIPTVTLTSVLQDGSATAINGTVSGLPGSTVAVELFDTPTCGNEGATFLGSTTVTLGPDGTAPVSAGASEPMAGDAITATATTTLADDSNPTTSSFSACGTVVAGPDNDTWTRAQLISLDATGAGTAAGSIDLSGQARWYKIPVTPGGTVQVNLGNLPANYDLTLFSDIGQAEANLSASSTSGLQTIEAQVPDDAYSPSIFSPSIFSPSIFSPSIFSPSIFSPSIFSPSIFSPSIFSPSIFSPSIFSPSIFSPSIFSPSIFSPTPFSPSIFSPASFNPSVSISDEQDYEEAQVEALLAISDNAGTSGQEIYQDVWNNTGYFYIRVNGDDGTYAPGAQFSLSVKENSATCLGVAPSTQPLLNASYTVPGPGYRTLILTNTGRMTDDGDLAQMQSDLQTFAGEPSVGGTIVDVGSISPQVAALQQQADANTDCPYADNLVAGAIRNVVLAVRAQNPNLQYIVLVGNDHVIPFFRYPDNAGIGPESGYVPPVLDTTPSYASLADDDFLSQDAYGSTSVLDEQGVDLPVPDLPVGRLVETPTQIDGMLQAYMSLTGGVVATPTSSLVTGYDFMTSGADAVEANLAAGLGPSATDDQLITNDGVSPSDTGTPPDHSWTATQLESSLLGSRHDLIFLAGHFSANNTLAADYSTTMDSTQLASSDVNLKNSIVFSAGCHSGYNISSEDAVPGVTQTTDWVSAFADHQATLIAGTGYQYGDTDFLAYSEQLYADFSQALLYGSGPVAVGNALVQAEDAYLDGTQNLQGIDIKSLLEATLYGLPMLSVDMPDGRIPAPAVALDALDTTPFTTAPGATLGLSYNDDTLDPTLTTHTVTLESPSGGSAPQATYLSGPDDSVSTSPAAPTLPLISSDVSVPNEVLRGVGFVSGTYTDQTGITPLTGAPATDLSGVHSTFQSSAFWPSRVWTVNYFGGLDGGAASTELMLTPAQYRSDAPGSLTDDQRSYSSVGLRLFYSDNTQTYDANTPALAAPPMIGQVSATVNGSAVTFQAHAVGDPSAGIQQVWVTYTGVDQPQNASGEWESLYLTQDPVDSTLWSGTLDGLTAQQIANLRFVVQAVNGVGEVGLDDNQGNYYQAGQVAAGLENGLAPQLTPTTLTLDSPPTDGAYGSTITVSATLNSGDDVGVPGEPVAFTVGDTTVQGFTGANGVATAQLALGDDPGLAYQLTAAFAGDPTYAAASATPSPFAIDKLATTLTLGGDTSVALGAQPGVTATLQSAGVGLSRDEVTFALTPTGATAGSTIDQTQITALAGVATLGPVTLSAGTYSVQAFFGPGGPIAVPADPVFDPSASTPTTLTVTGPPVVTTIATLSPGPVNGFYDQDPTVTLDATDTGGTLGQTSYQLDGGPLQTYTGPFTIAGDGPHTLIFYSSDKGGYVEPAHTLAVDVDTTPPVTTATVSPTPVGGVVGGPATITLAATDGYSGVASTQYSLDGGDWQAYTAPLTVSGGGVHVLQYRSTDVAGNTEATRTLTLQIEPAATGPIQGQVTSILSLSIPTPATSFGTFAPAVSATYDATLAMTASSTLPGATLTVADASLSHPGFLVNDAAGGPYVLAHGLQVSASDPAGTAGSGVVSDLSQVDPATLLTFGAPVSADPVTVTFMQRIGVAEPLRAGSYAKTITLTLSSSTP